MILSKYKTEDGYNLDKKIAESYIDYSRKTKQELALNINQFISEQIDQYKKEIENHLEIALEWFLNFTLAIPQFFEELLARP